MPRDLPLSNGSLHVAFDAEHRIRDLYYPHVGMENHANGRFFRMGVWVEQRFSWVGGPGWKLQNRYCEDTLVTDVEATSDELQISIGMRETVDFHLDVFIREAAVRDLSGRDREVRLFYTQDFCISGNDVGDTAYYDPNSRAMVHYKARRWFLANVLPGGISQFATGKKGFQDKEGTWRDCEDGDLQGNPIAQGSVDSAIRLQIQLGAGQTVKTWYWLAAAECYDDLEKLNSVVVEKTPEELIRRTENYWKLWVRTPSLEREGLPDSVVRLFYRSTLVVRTQIDRDGGVLAANDSDIIQFGKDTYSYVWPRDGALVTSALIDAGFLPLARNFFEFCSRVIESDGFFLHKYNPDGSLASSWHPWCKDGENEVPIQEDETALVLWCLRKYFQKTHEVETIKPLYRTLIISAAEFLVNYRDPVHGLPLPSHDLWEERRAIHAFTVATVIAALRAAAAFAADFGEEGLAIRYGKAAAEVRDACYRTFWDPQLNRFARSIQIRKDGTIERDMVIDASLYGLFYFHAYRVDDPRVAATMAAVRERLYVQTDVGGVARYENDYYHQVSKDTERVAGNPWFICTLWLAQYEIARAGSIEQLERAALPLLQWVADRALPSGVLAEQVNPYSGDPMSVSPLTWSHATFASAVMEYVARRKTLAVVADQAPTAPGGVAR